MHLSLLSVATSLAVYLLAFNAQFTPEAVDSNLATGVISSKVQLVYDSLVLRGNLSLVVTTADLKKLNLLAPWDDFVEGPLLNIAMSGGNEASYRIALMLIAASARPTNYSQKYGPAILYALGMGKSVSEDMAATIQGLLQNEKYGKLFELDSCLDDWHAMKNIDHDPPLLNYAIASNFIHGAFTLIADGKVGVNDRDKYDMTPLHLAAWKGHSAFASFLIGHGADPFAVDSHGRTILHIACIRGHELFAREFMTAVMERHKRSRVIPQLLLREDYMGHTARQLADRRPSLSWMMTYLDDLYSQLRVSLESEDQQLPDDRSARTASSIVSASSEFSAALGWSCAGLPATVTDDMLTDDIAVMDKQLLTRDSFLSEYVAVQRPVLITGNVTADVLAVWAHMQRASFAAHYGDERMHKGSIPHSALYEGTPESVQVTMSSFVTDLQLRTPKPICDSAAEQEGENEAVFDLSQKGKQALPARVCRGNAMLGVAGAAIAHAEVSQAATHTCSSQAQGQAQALSQDLNGFPALMSVCDSGESTSRECHSSTDSESDSDSGDRHRLSNRVEVTMGGYSSGTPAHAHESVWNVLLVGRKHWLLVPPGVLGEKKRHFSEPGHVLTHWDYLQELHSQGKAFHVTQTPGDVLFVPSGWAHATLNSCESVAVTYSLCRTAHLHDPIGRDHINFPESIGQDMYGGLSTH